jgi:hypothetical protein
LTDKAVAKSHKLTDKAVNLWLLATALSVIWFMTFSHCLVCRFMTFSHCLTLVTNPVISHEWGKVRIVMTTNGTYPWSFITHIHVLCKYTFLYDMNIIYGVTSGARTANPSGAPEFNIGVLLVSCCLVVSFLCCVYHCLSSEHIRGHLLHIYMYYVSIPSYMTWTSSRPNIRIVLDIMSKLRWK